MGEPSGQRYRPRAGVAKDQPIPDSRPDLLDLPHDDEHAGELCRFHTPLPVESGGGRNLNQGCDMRNGWMGLAIVSLAACMPFVPAQPRLIYQLPLTAVRPQDGQETIVEPGSSYEDAELRISAVPDEAVFAVVLENRSGATIRILWDQSAYVDPDGFSSRVVSGETRVIDAGRSQPVQAVPSGARAAFFAVPTSASDSALFQTCGEAEGKSVSLLLALEVRGAPREYRLRFDVHDAAMAVNQGGGVTRQPCSEVVAAEQAPGSLPVGVRFIVSISRRTIYAVRPECTVLQNIPERDRMHFSNWEDARRQGFRPASEPECAPQR